MRSRSLALQPKKPAGTGGQWRLPSGGTTPGPCHDQQAGEGERPGIQSKKTDLETSRGAGPRFLVSQTESCEVERSPGGVGPDAQREDVSIVAGARGRVSGTEWFSG